MENSCIQVLNVNPEAQLGETEKRPLRFRNTSLVFTKYQKSTDAQPPPYFHEFMLLCESWSIGCLLEKKRDCFDRRSYSVSRPQPEIGMYHLVYLSFMYSPIFRKPTPYHINSKLVMFLLVSRIPFDISKFLPISRETKKNGYHLNKTMKKKTKTNNRL